MNLDQYLETEGISERQFAEQCDVAHTTISRIRKGEVPCTLDTANKIIKASNGKITVDALLATWVKQQKKAANA